VSSNLVNVPVATAAEAFGNGVGAVAVYHTTAQVADEVTAGGPSKATGTAGLGSGNIAQAPVSAPVQGFGTGVSGAAKGTQIAVNDIDSQAGGDATSDGSNALGGGNVVSAPAGGAGQVYGESVAVLGKNAGLAGSMTDTEAGGDTSTSGQGGTISGNVVSPQAMPLAQSFAAVASGVGGLNSSTATNQTDAVSGGDIDTSGDSGFISGNLVDVPAAAVVQPFGDAVAAVGSKSAATGYGDTTGVVGGTSTTSGQGLSSLSGMDATLPVGANFPVYDVPVEVLAKAIAESANTSNLQAGEEEFQLNAPVHGGIAPTELPTLMRGARAMPADPAQGMFSGVLTGFAGGMTGVPGQDQVGGLADMVSQRTAVDAPQILPAPARTAPTTPVDGVLTTAPGVLGGVGTLDNVFGGQRSVPSTPDLGYALSPLVTVQSTRFGGQRSVPAAPDLGYALSPLAAVEPTRFGGQRSVPSTPDLGYALSPLSAVQPTRFGGFGRSHTQKPLEYAPVFGDLVDSTLVLPALPADVTTVLPVVPAAPVSADVPTVNAMGASARVDGSTLDSTRAALANLFSTRSIG
jgi:hypothetical protein